jgi:Tol biopolymer transport system component
LEWDAAVGRSRILAPHPALDYDATFSPDGRWLVFTSERRGNPDLWAIDVSTGAAPILLTAGETMQDAAAFSPDGRWLAFVDTREGNAEIFVMPFRPDQPAEAFGLAANLTNDPGGDFRPAFSPDGGRIAFSSDRDRSFADMIRGNWGDALWNRPDPEIAERLGGEIYVMAANGDSPRRLTAANGWDGSPIWSRDGSTLYFYSERDGAPRIWSMSPTGDGQKALSPAGTSALSPALMPDGRIAYAYAKNPEPLAKNWGIASVAADGFGARAETPEELDCRGPVFRPDDGMLLCYGPPPHADEWAGYFRNSLALAVGQSSSVRLPDRTIEVQGLHRHFPAPSPDGNYLATMRIVSTAEEEGTQIVVASLADGSERDLFRPAEPGFQFGLAWAGDWIAFSAGFPFQPEGQAVDIWKVRSNGADAVNLTAGSGANNAWPDFSRDWSRIVFRSGRDANFEIYRMDADGREPRRLTDDPARDTMPAMSPKGDRVAFTSNRDGDYEIYLLDLDEQGEPGALRRITRSPGSNMHVRFSPDGEWLVFTSSRGGYNDEMFLSFTEAGQTYGEIHAMRLADGLVVRLTHNKWEDGPVAWAASAP